MNSVITIPAFGDNFIYLCPYDLNKAFAIDPGQAPPVLTALKKHDLKLTHILLTHHHFDHTAGTARLKAATGCKVLGPDKRIPAIDQLLQGDQPLTIHSIEIQVIATPGHTHTSVCFYMPSTEVDQPPALWTGDTLFIAGCGRILECNPKTMFNSLKKLADLPDNTLIYPGHDYTIENYQFALTLQPNNETVKQLLHQLQHSKSRGTPFTPSTISREKSTNPFLRADTPELKTALNMPNVSAVELFADIRQQKDIF